MADDQTKTTQPEFTGNERRRGGPPETLFKPGNPGRPKGARSKLSESFLADLLADWDKNGKTAIEAMREADVVAYVRTVAGILPKQLDVKVNEFDDLTDDQLARQLAAIASQLARAGVDFGPGTGSPEAPQQPGELSTLQ